MKMRIRCQYGFGVDLPDVAEIHYETHPDDGEEYCGLLLGYIVQANVDRVALPRPSFKVGCNLSLSTSGFSAQRAMAWFRISPKIIAAPVSRGFGRGNSLSRLVRKEGAAL